MLTQQIPIGGLRCTPEATLKTVSFSHYRVARKQVSGDAPAEFVATGGHYIQCACAKFGALSSVFPLFVVSCGVCVWLLSVCLMVRKVYSYLVTVSRITCLVDIFFNPVLVF